MLRQTIGPTDSLAIGICATASELASVREVLDLYLNEHGDVDVLFLVRREVVRIEREVVSLAEQLRGELRALGEPC